MNEDGLWKLFFLTGLPEVWMVLRKLQNQQETQNLAAVPAFSPRQAEKTEC